MPVAVVIHRDVYVGAGRPDPAVNPVEHARRQLGALEVGHQLRAVIAMKARTPLIRSVQPHPRPPTGDPDLSDRLGRRVVLVAPLVSAQPNQLVGDDRSLDPPHGLRFGERHVATAGAVHTGDRADRVDAVRGGLDDLDDVGVPIRSVIADDTDADRLTG